MDDQQRETIKAFVRKNLGISRTEAERRIKEASLTTEERIYAWYRAGVEPGGSSLKVELMTSILEGSTTFDEWALIADSFSLQPYRTWATAQLKKFDVVTEEGLTRLARSKTRSLRKLAEELRAKLATVQ